MPAPNTNASPFAPFSSPPAAKKKPAKAQLPSAEIQAKVLGELVVPAAITEVLKLPAAVATEGVKIYLADLLTKAVKSKDPIETMIVEQLVMSHQRLIRLHAQAAEQSSPLAVGVYNTAAARLSSEFRRLTDALKKFRAPQDSKTTVVHQVISQQNVVEKGRQDVQFVDRGEEGSLSKTRDTKLNSLSGRFSDDSAKVEKSGAV